MSSRCLLIRAGLSNGGNGRDHDYRAPATRVEATRTRRNGDQTFYPPADAASLLFGFTALCKITARVC